MENNEQQKNQADVTHSYDGIDEHNNPMPTWWVWSFIITIIFSFHYYIHYELTEQGATLTQELEVSMQELKSLQTAAANKFPTLSEEELAAKLLDPNLIKLGATVFQGKCAMCHGDNLEGKIGPSLIDAVWVHGSKESEIIQTVRQGVAAKGMPPWEGILNVEEIFGVVALIKSKGM